MRECDYCGREREDVQGCDDPYARRVHAVTVKVHLCADCYEDCDNRADAELNN